MPSQLSFLRWTALLAMMVSLFFLSPARGQVAEDPEVREVFEHIYAYNLHSADSLVEAGLNAHPLDPEWSLLKATVAWWQLLAGNLEDEHWNKAFNDHLREGERKAKRLGKKDLHFDFHTILVYAMRTRYDLLRGNYFSAVNHLNASIDQVSDCFEKESRFQPLYLTSGLYYYFMQEAYEKYPLMRPYLFFYPDGDKQKGMDYLTRMSNSRDLFLRTEANYFLMRIYFDLEKDYRKASYHARKLMAEHPGNVMFHYYLVLILREAGEDAALREAVASYRRKVLSHRELSESQQKFFIEMLEKQDS